MLLSDISSEVIELIKNCDTPEIQKSVKDLVVLKEDEKGRYIERIFSDEPIPDNRCLSWYDKPQPIAYVRHWESEHMSKDECIKFGISKLNKVDHIYYLSMFCCGNYYETGDAQCRPGKPCKKCLNTLAKHWTYEEPVTCACWRLSEIYNPLDLRIGLKLSTIIDFIKK